MLAMTDKHGCVYSSVPGLADRAKVTRAEVDIALACFLAPDPDSRTKDMEGRRVEEIDGGWRLLNHAKFDRMRSEAEAADRRAESKRAWDREHRNDRPNAAHRDEITPVITPVTIRLPPSQSVTPLALAPDIDQKQEQEHVQQAARFNDFWRAYPIHRGKKAARDKWRSKQLDVRADELIADVERRKIGDGQWLNGYTPLAATYLHGERWEDEMTGRIHENGNGNGKRTETLHDRVERKLRRAFADADKIDEQRGIASEPSGVSVGTDDLDVRPQVGNTVR